MPTARSLACTCRDRLLFAHVRAPSSHSAARSRAPGTFLYAATMHILPEVLGEQAGAPALAAVVAGGLAPVLLSWGHSH